VTAPGFTGAALDRMDHLRLDLDQLAAALAHREARLLGLAGLDPVLDEGGRLSWEAVDGRALEGLILLGFEGGVPHFAPLVADVPVGQRAWSIFRVLERMDGRDAAIWGAARSLNEWHARHRFCGGCGSRTEMFRAGWGRRCANCGIEHFPRVDPVVIMLAEHGGRVLLGRQPQYPLRRYSALAGFVEPGESIEEAVARELGEEAGIAVDQVRYLASQPWPFPGSLMIGCVAAARSDALTLDTNELEDAIWVGRAGVEAALAGAPEAPFQAPPPFAIAHTLLVRWLEGISPS
jgi:NAD+ diphosphatase